jgi:hypothetical protein
MYGIRMESFRAGMWSATWAFPLGEKTARREGYDQQTITGSFEILDAFPGCPYCQARSMFVCECGQLSCWDGKSISVRCGWCAQQNDVQGPATAMKSGGDR